MFINYAAVTVNRFNTTVTRGAIFSSKWTRKRLPPGPAGELIAIPQTPYMNLGRDYGKEGKGLKWGGWEGKGGWRGKGGESERWEEGEVSPHINFQKSAPMWAIMTINWWYELHLQWGIYKLNLNFLWSSCLELKTSRQTGTRSPSDLWSFSSASDVGISMHCVTLHQVNS